MNEQAQNEQAQIDGKRRRLTRRTMLPLVAGSILLLVALAQCMLLGAFLGGLNSPLAARDNTLLLSYSDFQAQVAAGNVAWVTIDTTGADITGGLRHPISGTTGQGPTVTSDRVSTIYPFADTASLRSQLQAHGVEIRTAPPD